jgi:hypothetical protein
MTCPLVNRPVQVPPGPGDLDVGLVDEPPVASGVPAGPGGIGEQRGESLHPPVDRDVIDGDAALGQQLLHVPVRESVTQLPADSDRDHFRREPEPGKRRPVDAVTGCSRRSTHPLSLLSQPRTVVSGLDRCNRPLQRQVYLMLQRPVRWDNGEPSEDEKQAIIDALSNSATNKLMELSRRRLSDHVRLGWQEAYAQRGPGSTFVRVRIIASDVYDRGAPVPTVTASPDQSRFLKDVAQVVSDVADEFDVVLE